MPRVGRERIGALKSHTGGTATGAASVTASVTARLRRALFAPLFGPFGWGGHGGPPLQRMFRRPPIRSMCGSRHASVDWF